jgi:peptidoglycan hydrolase FlgJ
MNSTSQSAMPAMTSYADIARLGAAENSRNKTAKTGAEFETMVLSQLLKPMFDGLTAEGLGDFGGGEGEEAFKSLHIDAIAKQMTKSGGVGIAAAVQAQLIRMQEQSQRLAAPTATATASASPLPAPLRPE